MMSSALAFLLVVFLVGVLIFVHELGHFLAAKWAGVEVKKFYLGFDLPLRIGKQKFSGSLVRFQVGETQYGVGWLPLGGYVMMLGQNDVDPSAAPTSSPRDYRNRPWGWRLAIMLGGVAMNLLFAVIFTAIAFFIGINFNEPVVGRALQGGVAWQLGIESGDVVERVEDRAPDEFSDLVLEVVTAQPGQRVPLVLRRGDDRFEVSVLPERPTGGGLPAIGVLDSLSGSVRPEPGGPAALAGVLPGDQLVAWSTDGSAEPIPYVPNDGGRSPLAELWNYGVGSTVELHLERDGQPLSVSVTVAATNEERWLLGAQASPGVLGRRVAAVRGRLPTTADSVPVARCLVPGDLVLEVDGEPIATGAEVLDRLARPADGPSTVTLRPWWDAFQPLDTLVLLEAFPAARAPHLDTPEARAAYFASALDEVAGNERLAHLSAAFPHRPLLPRDVEAIDLALERARLGAAASTTPEFISRARAQLLARGSAQSDDEGVLEIADGDSTWPRFIARVRINATERHALFDVGPSGSRWANVTFRGDPLLDERAQRAVEAGAALISRVQPGSPLAATDLPVPCLLEEIQVGAKLVRIRGWEDLVQAVQQSKGEPLQLRVLALSPAARDVVDVTIRAARAGTLGLELEPATRRVTANGLEALALGWDRSVQQLRAILSYLRSLAAGDVPLWTVGGPILIVEASYRVTNELGIGRLLYLIAFISLNLAIINLFPVPPFDGGHVAMLLVELVRGAPPTEAMLAWFGRIGLLVFFALFTLVFWNDLSRVFGG